jgi:hypothetical protein
MGYGFWASRKFAIQNKVGLVILSAAKDQSRRKIAREDDPSLRSG